MKRISKLLRLFITAIAGTLIINAQDQSKTDASIRKAAADSLWNSFPNAFLHFGAHDGMPDSYIGSAIRLPDGRVAMRSADLVIWDGSEFHRYPDSYIPPYQLGYGPRNFNQYIDKDNHLWLKKQGEFRIFDLNRSTYITNVDSLLNAIGQKSRITDFFIDNTDTYWFVSDKDVSMCGPESTSIEVVSATDVNHPGILIGIGREADSKRTWMLFDSGIIREYDCDSKLFTREFSFLKERVKRGEQIVVLPLGNKKVAVMTDNLVGVFDATTGNWKELLPANSNSANKYTSMISDSHGYLWVSRTKHGVYVVDIHTGEYALHSEFKTLSGQVLVNDVEHITGNKDCSEVWFSLHDNGLLYFDERMAAAVYTDIATPANFKPNDGISSMVRLDDGEIIIGSGNGLYRMSPSDAAVRHIHGPTDGTICRTLHEDPQNNLWIGTFDNGLFCKKGEDIIRMPLIPAHYPDNVNYRNIRCITDDGTGNLWIAVLGAIGHYDTSTGLFTPIPDSDRLFSEYGICHDLLVDNNGHLYAACDKGTFVYEPKNGTSHRLLQNIDPEKAESVGRVRCNSLALDRDGHLWMGIHTGVMMLRQDGTVRSYGIEEGFSSPVLKVLPDNHGDIWVITATEIFKSQILQSENDSNTIRLIPYLNGSAILRNDQLSTYAVLDGDTIITATNHGVLKLSPSSYTTRKESQPPLFVGLSIFDKAVKPGEKYNDRVIYENELGSEPSITLRHDESNITVSFVNCDFLHLSSSSYRYMLEGVDNDWSEMTFTGPKGQVSYHNLTPGTYRMRVCALDENGSVSPEATFTIKILNAWWDTLWAKAIYLILALAAAYFIYRAIDMRKKKLAKEALKREEIQKTKELEEMKIRFFTNISHELRTPLTLIITPLQSIIDRLEENSPLHGRLEGVLQNARNLLMQVNLYLDFRKLEVGAEQFNPKPYNLSDLILTSLNPFEQVATMRNIDFRIEVPGRRVVVNADGPKLSKLLTNLVSNAMKYTPEGGSVSVSLSVDDEKGTARVVVADTGIGIPEAEQHRVFERFFRASNAMTQADHRTGSGVGLHLVKEYVDMHNGSIELKSKVDEGSEFILTLPLMSSEGKVGETVSDDTDRPLVILAEDNDEFRNFMTGELSEHYRVCAVSDGKQAFEQAKSMNPSIIVSDVMMPVMDGVQLTRNIKSDIDTSHIPVILLTAHANEKNETEGYEAGADAYISKPFNMHVLLTRIGNLIAQQHGRWKKFEKHLEVNPSEISITSSDEIMVNKALECVEANMDNTEFSVDDLSEALAMSKATMYRKLQAITGQTPNNFIRSIRLKRAAQLLRSSSISISEIAYQTGFSTPRYFSRLFKEEFGKLPTEYRASSSEEP